ncbi:GMC family oxidoreductase [Mesorhizobium sp. YR577]|uniref:GMC family oxidoreductase n=1 Tax=Mesorhizobium sp. YR577 TaxID=1884373 RepID=UPI000ABC7058|nr:GMC family oxidoreductase [Mesorhizobium sp. YR577]
MKRPVFSNGDAVADVVIVGSGVVGALIADQLAAEGKAVLVLDAGLRIQRAQAVENWRNMPFQNRAGSDFQGLFPQSKWAPAPLYWPENNFVELSGPDGKGFKQGYLKTVGGTTWHWAASSWRHLPVDLKMRSAYGVGLDWPISYDELEPYYCRAEDAMGVAGPNDPALQSPAERSRPYPMDMVPWSYGDKRFAEVVNAHGFRSVPIPQGRSTRPWNGRPTCCGNNNCQPICPIGAMYNGIHTVEAAEAKGALVLAESVVYRIDTDANNRVTAVHWYDNEHRSHKATGEAFVIACNSLESPRMLLAAANDGGHRQFVRPGRAQHDGPFRLPLLLPVGGAALGRPWPGAEQLPRRPARRCVPLRLFSQQDDPQQHHAGDLRHQCGAEGGPRGRGARRRDPQAHHPWR